MTDQERERLEIAACTPVPVNPAKFNRDAQIPYGLTPEHIRQAMEDFVGFLGFIDQQLRTRGIERLESMLMPANFSSIVGEFMSSRIPKFCPSIVRNTYHNGHPDLIPAGVFPNNSVLHDTRGIEIKASRYARGWQGHNAEAVWLMVFVFECNSSSERAKDVPPKPFRFMRVVGAQLEMEDWQFSGRSATSRRTITDNVDQAYTTTYTYDAYNRLTQATASAYTRYYAHDAWGNISNFSSTTFSYAMNASGAPATNRIATATNGQGTVGLSYDAAGNLTQDGSAVYNYDAANRLKEVGVGGSNTYGYDGDGMRVRQSSGGAAMFYVRSSVLRNVAMEVTATGGAVRAYVQAGNKTVAMSSRDGQFYWLHTNHLNSSRAMTDINGTLVYKGQYDPHGKALLEWSATNDTGLNSRKFTGYERDATGLDYANARTYASERGRFIQPDKLGLGAAEAGWPQSFNRYVYADNDPVNFVDPTGLDEEEFSIHVGTTWALYPRSYFGGGITGGGIVGGGSSSVFGSRQYNAKDPTGRSGGGAQDINDVIPPFNSDDQQIVDKALNKAKSLTDKKKCDEALKDYGIVSLDALVDKLIVSGGYNNGQRVYDGRRAVKAKARLADGSEPYVSNYLENHNVNAITSGDFIYLSKRFFDQSSEYQAITLIHEAVHLYGDKFDTDFGQTQEKGSQALSKLLRDKCL